MCEHARTRCDSAERWLLRAAQDERVARDEWTRGVALLVAGRTWDAVRVPYTALDASFDAGTGAATLRALLDRLRLVGPAFCDPRRQHIHFLVQPGTDSTWPAKELAAAGVECLGGSKSHVWHVGVPRADRTEGPDAYWLASPDRVAYRHVDAAHLLDVLRERMRPTAPELVRKGAR